MSEIIVWEAPAQVVPEFRLYYDDKGRVICYTCDTSLEGNFILVDNSTFAQGRPDVRVVDGRVTNVISGSVVSKLVSTSNEGSRCAAEDMSILVDENYDGEVKTWKLKTYEL